MQAKSWWLRNSEIRGFGLGPVVVPFVFRHLKVLRISISQPAFSYSVVRIVYVGCLREVAQRTDVAAVWREAN